LMRKRRLMRRRYSAERLLELLHPPHARTMVPP